MTESLQTKELRKKLAASILADQATKEPKIHVSPFNLKDLIILFEFIGAGYPLKTLTRRINLLTKKEHAQVEKLYKNIEDSIEKMDAIISNRAVKACDPWYPEGVLKGED